MGSVILNYHTRTAFSVYKYIFYNIKIVKTVLCRMLYLQDQRFKQQTPDKTFFLGTLTTLSENSKVVKSGGKKTNQVS